MYIQVNPNPANNIVGDCLIRAICLLLDKSWEDVFIELCVQAYSVYDMPNSNAVCQRYLISLGYDRCLVPDDIYTVRDFCNEYSMGKYLLITSGHAVTVIDGDYYDTWNSGDESPIYYFIKGDNENV